VREVAAKAVERFETDHPGAFPGDAVAFLQCVYKNPNVDLAVRLDAAGKAARFERPQLAAAVVRDATPAETVYIVTGIPRPVIGAWEDAAPQQIEGEAIEPPGREQDWPPPPRPH
jgi:hypothetical protein